MAFGVNNFKSNIGALQRPALYKIDINDSTTEFSFGDATGNILVKAAAVPASNIAALPVNYAGRTYKMTGFRTYDNWTTTILNDEDFSIRNKIMDWMYRLSGDADGMRSPAFGMTNTPGEGTITQVGVDGLDCLSEPEQLNTQALPQPVNSISSGNTMVSLSSFTPGNVVCAKDWTKYYGKGVNRLQPIIVPDTWALDKSQFLLPPHHVDHVSSMLLTKGMARANHLILYEPTQGNLGSSPSAYSSRLVSWLLASGLLVGWQDGWLPGCWLRGWLLDASCLAAWLPGWLTGSHLAGWLPGWLIG